MLSVLSVKYIWPRRKPHGLIARAWGKSSPGPAHGLEPAAQQLQPLVGEVDRRETVDAVKRFCLELRGYRGESSLTEGGRTRPLNRILEAAKIRKEGRPERGVGNDAENSVKGRHFLMPERLSCH
jgi:hypothetical protein